MSKTKKVSKEPVVATVFHGQSPDGAVTVIGIGNLRVLIVQEDDAWFAQGLEIDYAVQGVSLSDVKAQFEDGLAATIHENLKVYGVIDHLLKPAPPEVWKEFFQGAAGIRKGYNHVSVHRLPQAQIEGVLPFEAISYLQPQIAACA